MSARCVMVVAVAALAACNTGPRWFDNAGDAVATLLAKRPRVIAFGEFHEVKGRSTAASSLSHFTREILDRIAVQSSDLITETWVTSGKCGKTEVQAVAKVEASLERPDTVESEIVTMAKRAKAQGVQPHILEVDCDEYAQILPPSGETDYVALLGIITKKLKQKITAALAKAPPDRAVLVYGGALHNDLFPRAELADFAFGRTVQVQTDGRYLEIDLYVPEYIETDAELIKEPWYASWRDHEAKHPGKTALLERGKGAFIVLFPRTAAAPSAPSPPSK